MSKLPELSGRQVFQILDRHGFVEVSRRGNHIIMQLRLDDTTVTVPVPDHAELRPGTLSSIIRQSRLPRSEFEES